METNNIYPNNTVIDATKRVVICGDKIEIIDGLHCSPQLDYNIITVNRVGDLLWVTLKPTTLAKGVNTRAVHDFNLAFDVVAETEATLKSESTRASLSRTKRIIRELSACNEWDYFITITLDPALWDRMSPEGLQKALSEFARRLHNKQINGHKPWKGYAYLLIPEKHKDGAIHLHGLVRMLPDTMLVPYTLEEVNSDKPLPVEICDAVRAGEEVYHCPEWDKTFGYNTVTPIRDKNRIASYVTKYITKALCCDVFPTRYFHSRGLKRAEKVAEFIGRSDGGFVVDYLDTMSNLAVITDQGKRLQSANHIKIKGKAHLVNVTTMINIREHPLAEVEETLAKLCSNSPNCKGGM